MSGTSSFRRVIDALEAHGRTVKLGGDQADAQCPAHDDQAPSLSVRYDRTAGKVLVNCHTGCATEDIMAALALTMADLFDPKPEQDRARRPEIVTTYDYTGPDGVVAFQKVRLHPKDFRVRRPDGRGGWTWSIGDAPRVLYRLPELRAAIAAGRPVLLVEGEKDADRAVQELGMAATCNFEGAAKDGQRPKWRPGYTEALRGAHVLVVADRDDAGIAHARAVAAALRGVAERVRVVLPAPEFKGADLSDHLDAGHGIEGLLPLDEDTGTTAKDNQPATAVLVELSTVQPERLVWLWDGRLPAGKIVTIDGDPSVGKSTLAVDLAAHISTGKPWPDGAPCERADVLILSAEDGLADTIRPRLDAAGGDPTRVHALTHVQDVDNDGKLWKRPPTLADIAVIRRAIQQTSARLVIIDVLMAFLSGKTDSHKDQDIRAVLSQLTDVGEETGCTFLLLRHLTKAGGGSPMYRGGGSIGIVGAARAGYLVARDPEDPETRVLACVKSNLAKEPESLSYRLESAPDTDVAHIVWTGAHALDAAGLLRQDRDDNDDRREVDVWLQELLDDNGGSIDAKTVPKAARDAGFSHDQAKRAKKRLGIKAVKDGMSGGWSWSFADTEESTKGAKGVASEEPPSSHPSVLPSDESDRPSNVWRVSRKAV